MNQYLIGNTVQLSFVIVTSANVPIDPSSLELRVVDPNSVETDFDLTTLTRTGAGLYNTTVEINVVGQWSYRWEATGNVYAAAEGYLNCLASAFAVPN